MVLRDPASLREHQAQVRLAPSVGEIGGLAKPADGLGFIARAEPKLAKVIRGGRVVLIGRLSEPLLRLDGILGATTTRLMHAAEPELRLAVTGISRALVPARGALRVGGLAPPILVERAQPVLRVGVALRQTFVDRLRVLIVAARIQLLRSLQALTARHEEPERE